jgi:endonuclease/exonuclease/phosphatase family metal-dependent hydrolase
MRHPFRPPFRRFIAAAWLSLALIAANGCAGGHRLVPHQRTSAVDPAPLAPGVAWFLPEATKDLADLVRWRRSVGPPAVVAGQTGTRVTADRLVVVNWNVHVGGGDLAQLFADVRREAGTAPVVFLLQEAFRSGPEVPSALAGDATFASVIRGLRQDGQREEVEAVAARLGLHAYYVPSMRNGGPLTSDEDRGNAILSTIPLTDLTAIELPFERQRRVAVAATVAGSTPGGSPWRLRLVSAHLDTMSGARRLWIAGSEFARLRQARGLVDALAGQAPLVLGADMNTLFGFRDAAYAEAARAFPGTRVTDRRSTFHGLLRLDHLFFRVPQGWSAAFRRADADYGSDHYPLIGVVEFGSDPGAVAAR